LITPYYIDTSTLVPYYCFEPLSDQAEQFILSLETPVISTLTQLEFTSALRRKVLTKELSQTSAEEISRLFHQHSQQGSYQLIEITPKHFQIAEILIDTSEVLLHSLDALHLAVAKIEHLPIVTADVRLASAADALTIKNTLLQL